MRETVLPHESPDPKKVRSARLFLGLTQEKAGEVMGTSRRTWQTWEYGVNSMPWVKWEFFCLKTGIDPHAFLDSVEENSEVIPLNSQKAIRKKAPKKRTPPDSRLHRTTLLIPSGVFRMAERLAKESNCSLSEIGRRSFDFYLGKFYGDTAGNQ